MDGAIIVMVIVGLVALGLALATGDGCDPRDDPADDCLRHGDYW